MTTAVPPRALDNPKDRKPSKLSNTKYRDSNVAMAGDDPMAFSCVGFRKEIVLLHTRH